MRLITGALPPTTVQPGVYIVKATGPITIYECDGEDRLDILCHTDGMNPIFKISVNQGIEVVCADSITWSIAPVRVPVSRERPDPVPFAVTEVKPLTLKEEMQRFIRSQMAAALAPSGEVESFEEANDFDVDDDVDLMSPYEVLDMINEGTPPEDVAPGEEDLSPAAVDQERQDAAPNPGKDGDSA